MRLLLLRFLIVSALSLPLISWVATARAQVAGGAWSELYLLSSEAGKASEGYLVADQYGFVHAFWTETLFEDQRTLIQYARFDGDTWTTPNDIYVTGTGIENISPAVDQSGTLHVVWSGGPSGPVYYTRAPATDALSAQNWAQPVRIDIPAGIVRLRVDSRSVFHILYINRGQELGVYYVRSEDQGRTWSEPAWLDPDILPAHTPTALNFEIDETGGLHAVWFYGALDQDSRPDWVRYAHSLDGGDTWSAPFLIDRYVEEAEHNLAFAGPIMVVQGPSVHVIWSAGDLPYRHHRFSIDSGQTWSAPMRIFGELHGQAGDSLAIDAAGRVHFIGQIRYPVGIYHAYRDQSQWTPPSLIYLISQGDLGEGIGDRVHAHSLSSVVRAGNQLVLTFGDGPADPNRRLFAMHRTLGDISPLEALPTPLLTATPVPAPSATPGPPTPIPTSLPTAPFLDPSAVQAPGDVPGPDAAFRAALLPTLLFLGGFFVVRLLYKPKL